MLYIALGAWASGNRSRRPCRIRSYRLTAHHPVRSSSSGYRLRKSIRSLDRVRPATASFTGSSVERLTLSTSTGRLRRRWNRTILRLLTARILGFDFIRRGSYAIVPTPGELRVNPVTVAVHNMTAIWHLPPRWNAGEPTICDRLRLPNPDNDTVNRMRRATLYDMIQLWTHWSSVTTYRSTLNTVCSLGVSPDVRRFEYFDLGRPMRTHVTGRKIPRKTFGNSQ